MFKPGNKAAAKRKGKKYPKIKSLLTKVQLSDINTIDDLTRLTLKNLNEGLTSSDVSLRISTAVSIAKFLFPTKRESINLSMSVEDYLLKIEKGENVFQMPDHKPEISQSTALQVMPQNSPESQ